MKRRHEAEQLLRQRRSPSEIAAQMGISVSTAIQYLRTRVGEGALRLSDLYFAIPSDKRKFLQSFAETSSRRGSLGVKALSEQGVSMEEFQLFSELRRSRVFAGDMYEFVSETELALHGIVRTKLEAAFGVAEDGWWRKGVPTEIRMTCVARREQDDEPASSPFAYTDLIHLSKIIDRNWTLFVASLPKAYGSNRRTLESDLARLNRIRNAVMHPVKGKKWSEADFEFVQRLRSAFVTTTAS